MIEETFRLPSAGMQFVLSILAVFISIEAGFRFGELRKKQPAHEKDACIVSLVGAMLGLLALLMAFTFGMSSAYYESRREVVLKESNAIGTAYLRTNFIPDPERSEVRGLLREYVNVRVEGVKTGNAAETIKRSSKILDALWGAASKLPEKDSVTILTGLFVQALNAVIDIHSERLMDAVYKRIPGIIWLALYFVMVFSMAAVGYQFGLDGYRSALGSWMLALTFSIVMVLIADLDTPGKGMIRTSQWSMIELQNKLNNHGNGK